MAGELEGEFSNDSFDESSLSEPVRRPWPANIVHVSAAFNTAKKLFEVAKGKDSRVHFSAARDSSKI